MRYFFASAAALWVLAASAAVTPKHGALQVDFDVLRHVKDRPLARRDGDVSMALANEDTYYSADLKIGSDAQEVSVLVDTGSLDFWVMANDVVCETSSLYNKRRRKLDFDRVLDHRNGKRDTSGESVMSDYALLLSEIYASELASVTYLTADSGATATANNDGTNTCTQDGSFNTDSSDSFKLNLSAPAFGIEYEDGSAATGIWGTDHVSILGANVSDVSFAVVNDTSSTFGVLGIGLEGLEATYTLSNSIYYKYENFPVRLKNSGVINKVAYSLFLNDDDALSGLVLFGAVDHAKYSGQLTTMPILNIYPEYYENPIRFDVALDSISFETSSTNLTAVNGTIAALLDSGTTYTYLPTGAFDNFMEALGAEYSSSTGYYVVSCDYDSDSIFVVFNFSGLDIKVPLSDLIEKYNNQCLLTVIEQSSSSTDGVEYAVLGDNFLRNAYVVYDLEDYEISMAQASYSSDLDVDVISSSVPLAVKAEYYSSTSLTQATGSSKVTKLSSSLSKKSAASRSSAPQWAMAGVAALLMCFSLI